MESGLYICDAWDSFNDAKQVLDRYHPGVGVMVIAYRAAHGPVGFDRDEQGKEIYTWLLKDAWYRNDYLKAGRSYQEWSNTISTSFNFFAVIRGTTFSIHRPDGPLLRALREGAEKSLTRKDQSRRLAAILLRLSRADPPDVYEHLAAVLKFADHLGEWRTDYTILFLKDSSQFEEKLTARCMELNVGVYPVLGERDLPVW